jgi:hypothetical protein
MAKDMPYDELVKMVLQLKTDNDRLNLDNDALKKSDKEQTFKLDEIVTVVAIDAAIKEGFSSLNAMLEPLRGLRPARAALEKNIAAALEAVHVSLARPNYEPLESGGLDSFIALNSVRGGGKKS